MQEALTHTPSANGTSEEKEAKEYGRWVVFVLKHKVAFGAIATMCLGAYTTIQTLKSEMVQVKADVSEMKVDIREIKDALIEPTPTPKLRGR